MATVRMILAGAGLMACGFAFADDVAPVDANPPAQTTAVKAKPALAAKARVKNAAPVKASGKSLKSPVESKNASSRAGSGRMQVEEPKASAPMGTAKESRNWQKNHVHGLTEVQKQAFRERKEKMEGMIAVIKEKRMALRDAKPEERAVLARELHSLILEKDPDAANSGATAAASAAAATAASTAATSAASSASSAREGAGANVSDRPARTSVQADAEKKSEAAELRRQRIESYQSQQKKDELRRLQMEKIEKQRSGLDNEANTRNTFNAQAAEED